MSDEQDRAIAIGALDEAFVRKLRQAAVWLPELRAALETIESGALQMAEQRLDFAQQLSDWADLMVARGDAVSCRMAVARYYYSINHALRAAFAAGYGYDACPEGSGGHANVFAAVASMAYSEPKFLAKLRKVKYLGEEIKRREEQAVSIAQKQTDRDIHEMLQAALTREPYLSQEPDRRLWLEAELRHYENRGDSSARKAARSAIDAFLNGLHDLRKHADYDPAGRSSPGDEAVDFVAKSQYMAEIAHSVLCEVTAYILDVRRAKEA